VEEQIDPSFFLNVFGWRRHFFKALVFYSAAEKEIGKNRLVLGVFGALNAFPRLP
jgi:hypothetical protein